MTQNLPAVPELSKLEQIVKKYEPQIAEIAPQHVNPETFFRLAVTAVRQSAELKKAVATDPESFMLALYRCAALGHYPMRGQFALVPFRNRKLGPDGYSVSGVEEYRGVVDRMFRSGGVRSVRVSVGRQKDQLRFQKGDMDLPAHSYDEFASPQERGSLVAVWAWAVLHDGTLSDVAWLNRHDVAKYREKSKTGDTFWGPNWPDEGPWTEAMWKKTALHRLEPMVPTSADYRLVVARTEAAARHNARQLPGVNMPPSFTSGNDDIADAEVVPDDDWPATAQPPPDAPS